MFAQKEKGRQSLAPGFFGHHPTVVLTPFMTFWGCPFAKSRILPPSRPSQEKVCGSRRHCPAALQRRESYFNPRTSHQLPSNRWFGLVVWGFEPLVLVEVNGQPFLNQQTIQIEKKQTTNVVGLQKWILIIPHAEGYFLLSTGCGQGNLFTAAGIVQPQVYSALQYFTFPK